MSSTTVAEFASELKKSTDTLLEQLRSAGVAKSAATDALSEADKQKLLGYLQASHGTASGERKKITLVKKSTSEIKQADSIGQGPHHPGRSAQEAHLRQARRRRRHGRGRGARARGAGTAAAPPRVDEAELARREEEARRQAELIRRQEEDLAEKRRQREEAESARARSRRARGRAMPRSQEQKKVAGQPADQAEAAARKRPRRRGRPRRGRRPKPREKAAAESKARADEEAARAADLGDRRRKAEAEAAAIRSMMSAPKKVLVAPRRRKSQPWPRPSRPRPALKGTLHKPRRGHRHRAAGPGAAAPAGRAGAGKEVKSAKLSSSWAGDPAKKKAIPTRGDSPGGVGRNSWRGGPRGRRGNDRDHRDEHVQARTGGSARASKCTCRKPSRWPNSRTRWRSRPPK